MHAIFSRQGMTAALIAAGMALSTTAYADDTGAAAKPSDQQTNRQKEYNSSRDKNSASDRAHQKLMVRASKILDHEVVNPEGQDIGNFHDLVIDTNNSRIAYAMLSFGGFWGVGDKLFAVPWSSFDVQRAGDSADQDVKIVLPIAKSKFQESEGFDQDHWPNTADSRWAETTYRQYGQKPYWSQDQSDAAADRANDDAARRDSRLPYATARASDLIDQNVQNQTGETVGTISDLILADSAGRITYATIRLANPSEYNGNDTVAVPFSKLTWNADRSAATLNATADQLRRAGFQEKQWPNMTDNTWNDRYDQVYDVSSSSRDRMDGRRDLNNKDNAGSTTR